MKLGNKAFLSGGTVDSDVFLPDGLYNTMVAVPTQAGTVQVIFLDKYHPTTEHAQGSAIAGSANADNAFVITFPVAGAYAGAFMRYTNTSAALGTCAFSAGTDGPEN